jgi:hypothetical protein
MRRLLHHGGPGPTLAGPHSLRTKGGKILTLQSSPRLQALPSARPSNPPRLSTSNHPTTYHGPLPRYLTPSQPNSGATALHTVNNRQKCGVLMTGQISAANAHVRRRALTWDLRSTDDTPVVSAGPHQPIGSHRASLSHQPTLGGAGADPFQADPHCKPTLPSPATAVAVAEAPDSPLRFLRAACLWRAGINES